MNAMTKREIDKMCKLYQEYKLTPDEKKKLADAIKENSKTRKIARIGALLNNNFQLARTLT